MTAWIYLTSLVQTFFISLNRYLVITESKLNNILWNGKRKYITVCVTGIAIFILNASILTSIMQGCDMDSILGNTVYAVMFGSFQALTLCLMFGFYFLTLWKIYKLHQKTDCNLEHIDNNRRRINRMRKRMVKSMPHFLDAMGRLQGLVASNVEIFHHREGLHDPRKNQQFFE